MKSIASTPEAKKAMKLINALGACGVDAMMTWSGAGWTVWALDRHDTLPPEED